MRGLLSMAECIDAVRGALIDLAGGRGIQPLRPVMWLPERVGALGVMPGYLPSIGVMGIKTVSVFPGNAGTEHDSHQGTIMLFDDQHGTLLAIIDATEVTALRTAATSAVATDVLARPDASVLAVLVSGVQAGSHIDAMAQVRPLTEVRVWSRNGSHAEALVRTAAASHPGLDIRALDAVADTVAAADLVCTTTASLEPVLDGDLLDPGMHINAVGSSVPFARELDGPAMAGSRLFVDRRESTLNESGDFLLAKEEGLVVEDHIVAELGEVLIGAHPGR